jgi:hypothetical protein
MPISDNELRVAQMAESESMEENAQRLLAMARTAKKDGLPVEEQVFWLEMGAHHCQRAARWLKQAATHNYGDIKS